MLPAQPAYARVARVAGAHLALRRGFSMPEIDDLRMVIDQTTSMLMTPEFVAMGSGHRIDISYSLEANTLAIKASLVGSGSEPPVALGDECVRDFVSNVSDLVDEYTVQAKAASVAVRKTKS